MKMIVEKRTRCKRVPFMGYSVEAIVQNEPVNLIMSDEMHHFIIYLSPILDDEVRQNR